MKSEKEIKLDFLKMIEKKILKCFNYDHATLAGGEFLRGWILSENQWKRNITRKLGEIKSGIIKGG